MSLQLSDRELGLLAEATEAYAFMLENSPDGILYNAPELRRLSERLNAAVVFADTVAEIRHKQINPSAEMIQSLEHLRLIALQIG